MQNLKFRLAVEGLDQRCLPSVTPAQVNQALVHVETVRGELEGVVEHLNDPKTAQTLSFLPGYLRDRSNQSQDAFNVLADNLNALQKQVAANPALGGTLNEQIGRIAMAESYAAVNIVYAEFYAIAYGAAARVVVKPPSIDNGVNFGSGLPFSLTDPSWVTVAGGNGVRTWDVTPGTGATLANGSTFTATYTGYLAADGTVFDSGTLTNSTVGTGLITGFSTGLVGMRVGGNRRIDIPADQAYGANPPAGSRIPANARLVFDLRLTAGSP